MPVIKIDGLLSVSIPEYQVDQRTNPANGNPWANEAEAAVWEAKTRKQMDADHAALVAPPAPPAPPLVGPPIASFDFYRRFTPGERIAIRSLAKVDPVAEDFMHTLDAAIASGTPVRRDDPDLVAGLAYLSTHPTPTPCLTSARTAELVT